MTLSLELGQVSDPVARRALEQVSLRWGTSANGLALPAAPAYGTTLPPNPANGQEAILVDSLTASSWQWRLRYNAGSASAHKWEFIGGVPVLSGQAGQVTLSVANVWQALTGRATLIVPRSGLYQMDCSIYVANQGTGSAYSVYGKVTRNGADLQSIGGTIGAAWDSVTPQIASLYALNQGDALTWEVMQNAALSTLFASGRITLTPVKVS